LNNCNWKVPTVIVRYTMCDAQFFDVFTFLDIWSVKSSKVLASLNPHNCLNLLYDGSPKSLPRAMSKLGKSKPSVLFGTLNKYSLT